MLRLRDDTIAWREVDGEVLVLDLTESRYHALNESATMLWRMLGTGTTTEALAQALVDRYGVSAEEATADVAELLETCRARGYLVEG